MVVHRMRCGFQAAWFALALAFAPGIASAATYYVATDGNDGNSCGAAQNIGSPKGSINGGLGCLQGTGDTLYIRGGTYNETIVGGTYPSGSSWNDSTPGGSVVWVGAYNNESVIIEGGAYNGLLQMLGADYVVWDHLHLRGTSMYIDAVLGGNGANTQRFQNGEVEQVGLGSCPGGAHGGSSGDIGGILIVVNGNAPGAGPGMQFINNDLHHSVCAFAFYIQGSQTALLIEGNRIHDNSWYGIQVYNGGCGATTCFQNVVIRNNLIYNNGHGPNPQNGGARANGCAMTINFCDNCQIYNNVMYDNFCGIDITRHSANSFIYNNTFYNNPSDNALPTIQVGENASNITIRNNLSYLSGNALVGGNPAGSYTESNNLFGVDPQFVNPDAGDFHVQPTSPAKTASDTGGEVGAYGGNTCVGPDCGTPNPNPTPTPSACASYQSGASIPTGYGAPWDVFNPSSLLLNATCGSSTTANVGPATYVYHQGYAWDGSAWNSVSLNCTGGAKVSGAWCPGTASTSLPSNTSYYVAYTCAWVNNAWKCGCRDQQCATNYWQLQKIN